MKKPGAFIMCTVLSHASFAWLPFEAKLFNEKLGALWGTASFYLLSLMLSATVLAVKESGRAEIRQLRSLREKQVLRRDWVQFTIFSVMMVAAYYLGLKQSPPTSFQIWTRFDMFLGFILAGLLLGERCGVPSFLASLLGFGCWIWLLPWDDTSSPSLWFAVVYVLANGYLCVVTARICKAVSEGTLYLIRTVVVMMALILLAIILGDSTPNYALVTPRLWVAGCASAALLAGVIYFRFAALARGPLWLYCALGVIQVALLRGVGWLYGNQLTTTETVFGSLMFICAGCALYFADKKKAQS